MNQHTPTVDDNLGPRALAICTPILAIALILFSVRIISRTTPTFKLDYTDYIVSLAVLCEIVTYSFYIALMVFGFGRHTYYLSVDDIQKIRLCSFSIGLAGQIASGLARISIPALLIPFGTSRTWKIFLWSAIAIQVVTLVASQILLLCSCRPIRALWEIVPDAKCLPSSVQWTTGYVYSGITLVADCICAIAPLFVVLQLNRSTIERALMCCSMALGVVATIATVMRIKHMRAWQNSPSGDFRDIFSLYLLTRVEELILLVAASAPFLKPTIERVLRKRGMPTFRNRVRELNSNHTASDVEHGPEPKKQWYWLQSLKKQSTSSSAKVVEVEKGNEVDLNSTKSISSNKPSSTRM